MNTKLLLLTVLFVPLLLSSALAEPLSLPLVDKGGKGKLPTGLNVVTSANEKNVSINLSDGKLKYGVHNIIFKKGDLTYTRPRLLLQVPLEKAKSVTKEKPYQVVEFSHNKTPYKIELVDSGKSLPNVVITQLPSE